jgi:acetyltransferase
MRLDPLWVGDASVRCETAVIDLRPPGEYAALAISPYPEYLVAHFSAKGEDFVVRPIRPEDAEAHTAFMHRVPAEDLRFRFFTAVREVSPEQMARLTQIDYDREMAFVAVRTRDQATVGVARLVREIDVARGEFAIVVEPSVKGFGLAAHLMQRLIEWARDVGVREVAGTVLADNHPMIGFVKHLGFVVHRVPDEADVVEAVLEL